MGFYMDQGSQITGWVLAFGKASITPQHTVTLHQQRRRLLRFGASYRMHRRVIIDIRERVLCAALCVEDPRPPMTITNVCARRLMRCVRTCRCVCVYVCVGVRRCITSRDSVVNESALGAFLDPAPPSAPARRSGASPTDSSLWWSTVVVSVTTDRHRQYSGDIDLIHGLHQMRFASPRRVWIRGSAVAARGRRRWLPEDPQSSLQRSLRVNDGWMNNAVRFVAVGVLGYSCNVCRQGK